MPRSLPPLTLRTRAELYTQLGALETAGLPPDKAFGLVRLNKPSQPRLEMARKLLARGMDPAAAGEKSALFDKLESRLVRAALAAGSPARVYRRLGEVYARRAAQLASVKSKMLLPGLTLLVGLLTGPLPGLFSGAIGPGRYVWQVLWPLLLIAAFVQLGLRLPRWLQGSELEETVDALVPGLPLFGVMIVRRNARDFFQTLGMMLEAGIPMFEALPPAVDTISNVPMRHQYEALVVAVQGGATFAQALQLLPQLGDARVLAFVQTGESSGNLPEMLFRHAEMETADLDLFYAEMAKWIPRVIYGLVVLWTAWGMLSGPGLMTQIPKDL
ncbi:MAG TPA: type II secretion system F family protein [Burkholderiales bacterium]|jgi:general secretion pathway protein F|nr:type II secretion system F family protein [Burkholderiales bacterium]